MIIIGKRILQPYRGAIEDAGDEIILRLIPFKAVGAKMVFPIGFRPDYITVTEDSYEKDI